MSEESVPVAVAAGTPTDQLAAPAQGGVLVSSGRMVERQRREMEMDALETLDKILKDENHPLHDVCATSRTIRKLIDRMLPIAMRGDWESKETQGLGKLLLAALKQRDDSNHKLLQYILPRLGSTKLEISSNDEPFEIILAGMGPLPTEDAPDGDTTI